MMMKRTFADLFAVPPLVWGARGEPYLWEDMRLYFIRVNAPAPESLEYLETEVQRLFEAFTGHSIHERDWFHVEKYAHGGMSSGHIEPSCWREEGKILHHLKQNLILSNGADKLTIIPSTLD
jgi:hypothetical protein